MSEELFKKCFAFYLKATELDKITKTRTVKKYLRPKDQSAIYSRIQDLLNASDVLNPRFDLFLEHLLELQADYRKYSKNNFHSSFTHFMGKVRSLPINEMVSRVLEPSELDVKLVRAVTATLHKLDDNNEIFANLISGEGVEE